MVRLQGDFAKPPEQRFGYKHCFDALFRVRGSLFLSFLSFLAVVVGLEVFSRFRGLPPLRFGMHLISRLRPVLSPFRKLARR